MDELYLDDYEKAYQLTKLANDINAAIDDSTQISNKQELASLLDEINEKQLTGAQISEYEYEAYRKQYELLLAKAALEDAQNAKSAVRMSRDSEGNMSYVYTADEDAIASAESDYLDAAYSFAQLNDEEIQTAADRIVAILDEMETKIQEADAEARAEIIASYQEELDYWYSQLYTAWDWNSYINSLIIADN